MDASQSIRLFIVAITLAACSSTQATSDAAPPNDGAIDAGDAASSDSGADAQTCACVARSTTSCHALAGLYADDGHIATCRASCASYDVSTCTYDTSGKTVENVYPGERDARFSNARCNDKTPFDFRVSLTGSRRWIVFFEGGGACDGLLIPCAPRLKANPALFSSSTDAADGTTSQWNGSGDAILSRDVTKNPTFADANIAIGNYCSSDLWTGTSTTPVAGDIAFDLLFAGRTNAKAMLQTLVERYGFDDAKDIDVIVSGSSAGGNGARNNTDLFANAFPAAVAANRVWSFPVAGFQIYEWNYPGAGVGGTDADDPSSWEAAYVRWSAELNPKCLALASAAGHGPGACFAGLYASQSLVMQQPQGYGVRVLDATNRTDPVYLGYHGVTPATPNYTQILDTWESIIVGEMQASNLRWQLAPEHRGTPNVHGLMDFWTTPIPAYDAAKDKCSSPWPTTITTFRDLVDAFYRDTTPQTSGIKVCPPTGWPY